MPDKTGYAFRRLRPVIYLENSSGHLLLLPEEIGKGTELARKIYEERYRAQGYEWCEAGTLDDVDKLQQRLAAQERAILQQQADRVGNVNAAAHKRTASSLYNRLTSAGVSQMEKDMIRAWLDLQNDKKCKWQGAVEQTDMYIWAREQDAGTQVADRMMGDNKPI